MKPFRRNLNSKLILSALIVASSLFPNIRGQESKSPVQETIPDPSWRLNTDDTYLTVAIVNNRPAIYGLTNPGQGWNWIPGHAEFPLLASVIVGENRTPKIPDWSYRDAVVDQSDGTKLTLRFTSTIPKLELNSIWRARKGPRSGRAMDDNQQPNGRRHHYSWRGFGISRYVGYLGQYRDAVAIQ